MKCNRWHFNKMKMELLTQAQIKKNIQGLADEFNYELNGMALRFYAKMQRDKLIDRDKELVIAKILQLIKDNYNRL